MTNSATIESRALALLSQPGNRAALVSVGMDGKLEVTPVHFGDSVLNLHEELIDHLNAQPLTDAFVQAIHDWAAGRMAATAEARRVGGFIIPRSPQRWEVAHVPAFVGKVQ